MQCTAGRRPRQSKREKNKDGVATPKEIDNSKSDREAHLQGSDGGALEPEIRREVLSDLTNQSLEGQLADEQFRRLLVTPDLSESDRSRTVTMRLLDASGGRSRLPCGLGGQLLPRSFSSGRFTGSLLSTSHY